MLRLRLQRMLSRGGVERPRWGCFTELAAIQVLLAVLKVLGVLTFAWEWVLLPVWIAIALFLLALFALIFFKAIKFLWANA